MIFYEKREGRGRVRVLISLKKKSHLFWVLQTSGWLLFLILSLMAYWTRGMLTMTQAERYTTGMASGFLVTLALRYVYRKVRTRNLSVLRLSLTILIGCLLGLNALIWLWNLLQVPFLGWPALAVLPKLSVYLYRIVWWFIPIIGWSALYFGVNFWQEWMARRERTEQALALTQTAQLHMLRYRMNPHFLFNALNSIRALIAEDRTAAKNMVTELSEFLRYSLVSKNYKNVPFKEECESVRHFFNIQKVRYENKLDVSFHIDPATEDFPVVSFLLHPLAENAVRYGMRTSPLPLNIQVKAEACPGGLQVEISNSGSWIKPSEENNASGLARGLDYVRRRLAEAYPRNHRFEIFEKENAVHARLFIGKDA
jgi:two-component system LytT family sensor kinase